MSNNNNPKTPEQLKEERRQDVMAYAFQDKDGKFYAVNADGDLQEAPAGTKHLSPAYQAMANKTAALALLYRRIETLNKEDQQSLMARLTGKVDGASKGLSGSAQAAMDEFKVSLKDFGIKIPGEDTANFLGQVFDGMALPVNFVSETLGSITGVASRLFTKELSREEALAIGTAYASARQAAVEHHPKMDGIGEFFSGLFSKHFGSVAVAGFFQLLDVASGFLEGMPGIGDWVKKQGWHDGKSFTDRLGERLISDDNAYAKQAMGDFKNLGGQSAETISKLLVDGGQITTQSGESVAVGKDEKSGAPTADKLKNDVDAQLAANEKDKQSWFTQKYEAVTQGVNFDKTGEAMKNNPAYTLLGGTFTAQVGRGAFEGMARGGVNRAATKAEKAAKELEDLEDTLKAMKKSGKTHHNSSWKPWEKGESVSELKVRRTALTEEVKELQNIAEVKNGLAGNFTKTAMEDISHSSWIERLWDKPRKIGRVVGDATESVVNGAKEFTVGIFTKSKAAAKNVGASAMDAAVGSAEGANEVLGAVVVAAEENPSLIQKFSKFVGKWGSKGLAYVAPAYVGGQVMNDVANKDIVGGTIHGSEFVGIGTAMYKLGGGVGLKGLGTVAKIGATKVTPYVAPVMATGELTYAIVKGDKAGMVEHGTELGTIASFAAAGAAIGAPVGGVGAIPGALIGATVGGIASIFTGWGARSWYESGKTEQAAAVVQQPVAVATVTKKAAPKAPAKVNTAEMDLGFQQILAMDNAKRTARNISFNPGVSTKIGAVKPEDITAPQPGQNASHLVLG